MLSAVEIWGGCPTPSQAEGREFLLNNVYNFAESILDKELEEL